MPLINLQTNLKSLSYNGNGPYVEKNINNPGRPASEYIQGRVDDTTRMLRLLGDKGIAFTSKQALLLAGTRGLAAIPQAGNILANIVAQVPVNGTGTHFLPIDRNVYYTAVTDAPERALQGGAIGNPSGKPYTPASRTVDRTSAYERANFTTVLGEEVNYPKGSEYTKPTEAILTVQTGGKITINNAQGLDTKYGFAETKKSDSVNLLDIGQGDPSDDFVPVIFNLYGDSSSRLLFRGFIENLTDTYNGSWSPVSYVGRMEQFFTYTGFTRSIGFQLVVPIFSQAEQPIVYNRANSLVSYTAPSYRPGSDLPQGNIISLTLGNYIRTNGVLNSVGITIANDTPWSYSAEGEYLAGETRLLPQVLTLNITFTPIHNKTPEVYTTTHTRGSSNTPYFNNSLQ